MEVEYILAEKKIKVAIALGWIYYLESFFINLARYLEANGHEVDLISGSKYFQYVSDRYGCSFVRYPKYRKYIDYYSKESQIVKYLVNYTWYSSDKIVRLINEEFSKSFFYFDEHQYSLVIMWNGTFNVERDICELIPMKTLYIENGYFPKTIQANPDGVNAKSRLRKYPTKKLNTKISYTPIKINTGHLMTILRRYCKTNIKIYQLTRSAKYILRNITLYYHVSPLKKVHQIVKNEKNEFVFFPLQASRDSQIVINSRFKSMDDCLAEVLPVLREIRCKIILKCHPADYHYLSYKKYADNQQIFLVYHYDLDKLIDNAKFVVTINSSVGLQSVAKYKKVVLLGDALYEEFSSCIKYKQGMTLKDIMKQLEGIAIDKKKVDEYIKDIKDFYLIPMRIGFSDEEFLSLLYERMLSF